MLLQIQPYSRNLLPAIALFNSRLQEAGIPSELRLPLDWVEPSGDSTREERYLIVEDTMVRGGYILRHERFWINREVRGIGFLRLPLSEGIINKSFAPVGARILKTVSTQSIPLFALGMGGTANPFPRMLSALGWSIFLVPFYYRVYSVAKVLKDIRPVPRTFVWRAATDIASHSGMGWLLFNTLQSLK